MIIIFVLAFLIFYWIGINKFNHINIDKAYVLIDQYIKQFIKEAERDVKNENYDNESSYYEDKHNLDKKLKKRLYEEKKLESLVHQIKQH
tara:strand:+ start:612 stop:881 length:270 start_codon:yes stop_codon:yes gene_type:complete